MPRLRPPAPGAESRPVQSRPQHLILPKLRKLVKLAASDQFLTAFYNVQVKYDGVGMLLAKINSYEIYLQNSRKAAWDRNEEADDGVVSGWSLPGAVITICL